MDHSRAHGVLCCRVIGLRPSALVGVRTDEVKVRRDIQASSLRCCQCLRQAEKAGAECPNAFSVECLGCNHGRSGGWNLDAVFVSAHTDLGEFFIVAPCMFEDSKSVVSECGRDLNENASLDERHQLGGELSALESTGEDSTQSVSRAEGELSLYDVRV